LNQSLSDRPAPSFRPDRFENVNLLGQRPAIQLGPGVNLDCLVGHHNGARNLTTGIVDFAPLAHLFYHTHPMSESVTVLSGALRVNVEGREYALRPLDNIVIPRGLVHSARNDSSVRPARLHVAFASAAPGREWVSKIFETCAMPDDSTGIPGKERVTRFISAPRSEAGPGTSFIDYFNEELVPGIEMSGGYGLFQTGGRLPAHYHDFDESICIVQGVATCVCEGRHHQMSNGATALQPRGRVHYFVNNSEEPMAMVWVYAGSLPERILAEDGYATGERNPWE
jgi:quercetin dioxygenase-like cupin family protein